MPGPFCPVTSRRHYPPHSPSSDDDSDDGTRAPSNANPAASANTAPLPETIPPPEATPSAEAPPPSAGQALTRFNNARAVALLPEPIPSLISVTLEVFVANVDVTEVSSINSCLLHIIRHLLDYTCQARKFNPTEFRFKVIEMTSLNPNRPVTFYDLAVTTTNRTKEKLYYLEREKSKDPVPVKPAKRPRSKTQSGSKVAKGFGVVSKKVKVEKKDKIERGVRLKKNVSDKLIGTIKDDLTE
ncbi:hypothetical protein BT67DRAFT_464272 [Trichocladium antarcticum]|uniref:Uncharacterized protein n=1 Tax=Trichocladium antarcticum TaxID=1450529 RepID=A0AAN6UEK5_9PEZI|nr:hypothetical protein BT67DRAFT_464272 [Trichocladium antarcticum]